MDAAPSAVTPTMAAAISFKRPRLGDLKMSRLRQTVVKVTQARPNCALVVPQNSLDSGPRTDRFLEEDEGARDDAPDEVVPAGAVPEADQTPGDENVESTPGPGSFRGRALAGWRIRSL